MFRICACVCEREIFLTRMSRFLEASNNSLLGHEDVDYKLEPNTSRSHDI